MPQEAKPSLNEKSFILTALRKGIRLDGRPLDAYRDIDLSFGQEYGAVDVKLGKTRYTHLQTPVPPYVIF
jgi:exosome complex component RRP45